MTAKTVDAPMPKAEVIYDLIRAGCDKEALITAAQLLGVFDLEVDIDCSSIAWLHLDVFQGRSLSCLEVCTGNLELWIQKPGQDNLGVGAWASYENTDFRERLLRDRARAANAAGGGVLSAVAART